MISHMSEVFSVTGFEDPEGEAPWVMQLVALVDKKDPPSHTAVCTAAATAVVMLLADQQAGEDGAWRPALDRWVAGRIRKHARRARNNAWNACQFLPGVTAAVAGATVRAFVPCPTDRIPKEIAKLQLQGFELDDERALEQEERGALLVSISADPVLPTGKAAAAAAHAAQVAWMKLDDAGRRCWQNAGFPIAVRHPDASEWSERVVLDPIVIRDGGFTVVAPGTVTATARWV